jgi:hypothetical protein
MLQAPRGHVPGTKDTRCCFKMVKGGPGLIHTASAWITRCLQHMPILASHQLNAHALGPITATVLVVCAIQQPPHHIGMPICAAACSALPYGPPTRCRSAPRSRSRSVAALGAWRADSVKAVPRAGSNAFMSAPAASSASTMCGPLATAAARVLTCFGWSSLSPRRRRCWQWW